MRYLSLADTKQLDLRMRHVVPVVEDAFRRVGEGRSVVVPRVRLLHPPLNEGDMGAGRPWVRDLRIIPGALEEVGYAVRLGASVHRKAGGVLLALFDWDDMSIKALISDHLVHGVRSTAPDGVLAQYLALEHADTLAVIGSGRLARWAAEAIAVVRPLRTIRLWSPTQAHRRECVAYLLGRVEPGVRVEEAPSAEAAVRSAQIVVSATNARGPVLDGKWLVPGCTVITNTPEELDHETLRRGRLVSTYREGILTHVPPYEALMDLFRSGEWGDPCLGDELGDIVAGKTSGRASPDEIIVCLNPAYGVLDAATANYVYDEAVRQGVGTVLEP